jgi:uncharacterized protein YdeI (YjbR/CyaY-like superfamily)
MYECEGGVVARLADLPMIEPANREEWRAWLETNHRSAAGAWIAIGKKGGSATELTYEDAVLEALAFGWIDSIVNRLDAERFKQLMTPRKQGSVWARSNKERVTRLIAEGKMAPAGMAVVEAAKADGSYYSLDDVEALIVPEALALALAADPKAAAGFEGLSPSARKMVLYWIAEAKRPETRARRIEQTVAAAREGRPPR